MSRLSDLPTDGRHTLISPDDIHERLRLAGEEWADKAAAADMLEAFAEAELARQFIQAQGSIELRKAKAKVSVEYDAARKAAIRGKSDANKARVYYDSAKAWLELTRTLESTRRAELTLR